MLAAGWGMPLARVFIEAVAILQGCPVGKAICKVSCTRSLDVSETDSAF
jgi:hypothetical protein